MARDSLFGERIVWTGRPETLETPPFLVAVATVFFVISAVSTLFAVVVARALQASPTSLILLGGGAASLGVFALQAPKVWLAQVRYLVTENRVIVQRGLFKRTIERQSISFARVFWNPRSVDVGDLELVRAVQTGALHRRLTLRLRGIRQPSRVWAIIRGAEEVTPIGRATRPLAQRLDRDERVLWAARPRPKLRTLLPRSAREWGKVAIGLFLIASLVTALWRAVPNVNRLAETGMPSGSLVALVAAEILTALLLVSSAGYLLYDALVRSVELVGKTRYLITNKHVLISRGYEELHLLRDKIVDVIDTPSGEGVKDVFLVLDGPRARALAASGAFGEMGHGPSLRPVFHSVDDADSVSRILRPEDDRGPGIPRAA